MTRVLLTSCKFTPIVSNPDLANCPFCSSVFCPLLAGLCTVTRHQVMNNGRITNPIIGRRQISLRVYRPTSHQAPSHERGLIRDVERRGRQVVIRWVVLFWANIEPSGSMITVLWLALLYRSNRRLRSCMSFLYVFEQSNISCSPTVEAIIIYCTVFSSDKKLYTTKLSIGTQYHQLYYRHFPFRCSHMTPPIVFIILIKLMPRPSYHFFSFVWIKMMADRKPFPIYSLHGDQKCKRR